jgi:hypothetical protein
MHGLDPGALRRRLVPIAADRRTREQVAADAHEHDECEQWDAR